jgi:hypothetical protein
MRRRLKCWRVDGDVCWLRSHPPLDVVRQRDCEEAATRVKVKSEFDDEKESRTRAFMLVFAMYRREILYWEHTGYEKTKNESKWNVEKDW